VTLGERLCQLSGLPPGTATFAQHMKAISKLSAGALSAMLIAYSGIPAGTANLAQHLLTNPAVIAQAIIEGGGGQATQDRNPARAKFIRRQNEALILALTAALTRGMLD
jgi:hypothetical protein